MSDIGSNRKSLDGLDEKLKMYTQNVKSNQSGSGKDMSSKYLNPSIPIIHNVYFI